MSGLKRAILHWTVGRYKQKFMDYHYLIDDLGNVTKANNPEININCYDGEYCPHAGGFNTGSIGIGLMAMLGYLSPEHVGNYPITKKQFETACLLMAQLGKKYEYKENLTHAEVGLFKTGSKGKIDINYLPFNGLKGVKEVGDYMRRKIYWYSQHLKDYKDLT